MILSGEDSCCPGLELSLHTQTSCQWSPHPTGVAGDLGDRQLWGGPCNWPGPWWPCGETHCSFLPGSCFTLSVTGRGQQGLPGRPRTPWWPCQSFLRWRHIRQAPLSLPSPPPGLTWAAMFWQFLHPHATLSQTFLPPVSLQGSPMWCLLLDEPHNQHFTWYSTSPLGFSRRSHLHMIEWRLREFHRW